MSDSTPNPSTNPTSNVKIYDRPERTMPSPLVLVLIVLAAALCCFFLYRAMHPAAPAANAPQGLLLAPAVVRSIDRGATQHAQNANRFADLM